jgi:hypothetical protein
VLAGLTQPTMDIGVNYTFNSNRVHCFVSRYSIEFLLALTTSIMKPAIGNRFSLGAKRTAIVSGGIKMLKA